MADYVVVSQTGTGQGIEKVVVHPLVLLSIVDNYNRVSLASRKRVLGVLLGSTFRGRVDITNSYAGRVTTFPVFTQRAPSSSLLTFRPVTGDITQFHSKKMTKMQAYGSWIITTTSRCLTCSRPSTVRMQQHSLFTVVPPADLY